MSKLLACLRHEVLEAVAPFMVIVIAFHLLTLSHVLGIKRMPALFPGPLSNLKGLTLPRR